MAEKSDPDRERRRAKLGEFYQNPRGGQESELDLDGVVFDAERYTSKLIKEASLSQLLNKEDEISKQIRSLDSEMQTLVYENYNKFILATDTIQKMRSDFGGMEGEMTNLATKMGQVAEFSRNISSTLGKSSGEINRLSKTHATLKKLQFLFDLPNKLEEASNNGDYTSAVKNYIRSLKTLKNSSSFDGIKKDCDAIMEDVKKKLRNRLKDYSTGTEDLNQSVDCLLQMGEPPEELCNLYLETAKGKLNQSLKELKRKGEKTTLDILEFTDLGCNTFISDLCLVVASYVNTFVKVDESLSNEKLVSFLNDLMDTFMDIMRCRLKEENDLNETPILVRALDRFHRRLQAMSRLVTTMDFNKSGLDLILEAANNHCKLALESLRSQFSDAILQIRQQLAALNKKTNQTNLTDINAKFILIISNIIRDELNKLVHFIDSDIHFAMKTYFRSKFCRSFVREGILVNIMTDITQTCKTYCIQQDRNVPPLLILLLSRSCYEIQSTTTSYLLNMTEENFCIEDTKGLTSSNSINEEFRNVSHQLLDYYVRLQGQVLSQMIRKSVETRDWLNTVEPRTVRAVMKRIVEETTSIDRLVGELYEEGFRKARSSDSSRRTRFSALKSKTWNNNSSGLDNTLVSNIQKMFSEKVEIYSPVEFSKISILSGIVKIALKTLLECVRLRTFSRFGFQQLQVDCHYLYVYMWRFVSDENIITFLLDEIMTSGVHRCLDPSPMEHSVVEVICDRS
ncbi:vacuolar protein sorting-associated protein 51 homolog [Lepeophtheirus salmonis]|uniref:vacuolar protein sorting-associated protein 51 homolog n=1 Tax=Lepeophtheirus salmonis TaxID=72036 RepID=UPI001AE135BF|nr:vacuolar protein sorting-associated protein 51 homolog [Lepeophtheirus salmonis]